MWVNLWLVPCKMRVERSKFGRIYRQKFKNYKNSCSFKNSTSKMGCGKTDIIETKTLVQSDKNTRKIDIFDITDFLSLFLLKSKELSWMINYMKLSIEFLSLETITLLNPLEVFWTSNKPNFDKKNNITW